MLSLPLAWCLAPCRGKRGIHCRKGNRPHAFCPNFSPEKVHMKRVVLAGGNGFLGQRLAKTLLISGYEIVVLTRSPRGGPVKEVVWDGRMLDRWADDLDGAVAL